MLRVLLVENSTLLAARLREAIGQLPAVDLVDVVNGEAATIAALEMHAPDLLILDLELNDGSGFGVLRHLRAKRAGTEVIVYSSYSSRRAVRMEAEKLGAATFLDKARDFERLYELLLERSTEKQSGR